MLLTLLVAVILFCSHQQVATAREVAVAVDGNELQLWPWKIPCYLRWPFPFPRPYPCSPPRPRPRPCPPPPPPPCPPPPAPSSSCSASDQAKVKKCMFNTTSIDECCPTFKSILPTSCPCYKYAENLDNQVLITLEAYCDVDSPCKGLQVIKLSKEEE
uniref:Cysteine-rich extensin-like protein-4 n=1 Tax=Nicotiana tabacum TaxID=4097 RepID=Q08197_TOBAC|nr:cysteine-rich extensin-like protein-4 [Nicotiana tabacum]